MVTNFGAASARDLVDVRGRWTPRGEGKSRERCLRKNAWINTEQPDLIVSGSIVTDAASCLVMESIVQLWVHVLAMLAGVTGTA
jgi:hypothetical protein